MEALIRVYGIACWLWRIVVVLGLLVAAANLFHGAGILLSVVGIIAWLVVPASRLVSYLVRGRGLEQPNRLRFLLVSTAFLAIAAVVLARAPWPFSPTAYGIIEFAPVTIVRTPSSAFVREAAVHDGDRVVAGDLLFTLENEELTLQLQQLDARVQQSMLRCRSYKSQTKMAAFEAESSRLKSLRAQLLEKQLLIDKLSVTAPVDGTFMRRNVSHLVGTYVQTGDELGAIGRERAKELRITLAQDDARRLASPARVTFRIPGVGRMNTKLERIEPRATTKPLHASLSALYGGPLAVREIDGTLGEKTGHELLEPRITAIAPLTPQQGHRLKTGQRCAVGLGGEPISVGSYFFARCRSYWRAIQESRE